MKLDEEVLKEVPKWMNSVMNSVNGSKLWGQRLTLVSFLIPKMDPRRRAISQ